MPRLVAKVLWAAVFALVYSIVVAYAVAYFSMDNMYMRLNRQIFTLLARRPIMELVVTYAACFAVAWFQVRRWYAKACDYEEELAEEDARRSR